MRLVYVFLCLFVFNLPCFGQDHLLVGKASWYGPHFHGRKTASGEVYNMYGLSVAHKTLPLGTKLLIVNPKNHKKVVVRVNDRGPYINGRVFDLSKGAAVRLNISGVSYVEAKVI